MLVLIHFVTGEFAAQDLGKRVVAVIGGHTVSWSSVLSRRLGSFAKRSGLAELEPGLRHIGALAPQIVCKCAAQIGIGDVVRRVGGLRQVTAPDLMLALRAGLDR